MPEPLVSAFIAGAMFCGICGYDRKHHRRLWFAGVWIFAALACLTKGLLGIVYPAVVLCFGLDFLSRSEDTVSRASAVAICTNLSFDPGAVAHLGAMAFPALLSLFDQVRMAGTLARAY